MAGHQINASTFLEQRLLHVQTGSRPPTCVLTLRPEFSVRTESLGWGWSWGMQCGVMLQGQDVFLAGFSVPHLPCGLEPPAAS